jgi:N-acetylmuramoyl-L-alanine amidase
MNLMPKCLFIEAWHGGISWNGKIDNGAVAPDGTTEREINVDVARSLIKILNEKLPLTAVLSVWVDTNARSDKKVKYVNNTLDMNDWHYNSYFISLHCNSFTSPASWLEIFIRDGDKKDFAEKIKERMLFYYNQNDRWVKTNKNLYINKINCNAILIEMWFLNDKDWLDFPKNNPERLAESIANGVLEYFRNYNFFNVKKIWIKKK